MITAEIRSSLSTSSILVDQRSIECFSANFWTLSPDTPRTTRMPTLRLVRAAACSEAITPSPKRATSGKGKAARLTSAPIPSRLKHFVRRARRNGMLPRDRARGYVALVARRHTFRGCPDGPEASSAR